MESNKHPLWWMILFGVVRHGLTAFGAYLVGHGIIDAQTHERLVSEGTTEVVGFIIMIAPIIWSALQKKQSWGWVKTALHLDSATPPAEVIVASPGPNQPI